MLKTFSKFDLKLKKEKRFHILKPDFITGLKKKKKKYSK